MRPLLSSALVIERPGRDGISDPGDLRITVHQVSEECALQFALVASEQDNSDREGLYVLGGLRDR